MELFCTCLIFRELSFHNSQRKIEVRAIMHIPGYRSLKVEQPHLLQPAGPLPTGPLYPLVSRWDGCSALGFGYQGSRGGRVFKRTRLQPMPKMILAASGDS